VHHVPGERKFHCPCHGGVFDESGAVEAGPPPAPLRRFEVAPIGEDGVVRLVVTG
jgi:Rieske Fe-S protein